MIWSALITTTGVLAAAILTQLVASRNLKQQLDSEGKRFERERAAARQDATAAADRDAAFNVSEAFLHQLKVIRAVPWSNWADYSLDDLEPELEQLELSVRRAVFTHSNAEYRQRVAFVLQAIARHEWLMNHANEPEWTYLDFLLLLGSNISSDYARGEGMTDSGDAWRRAERHMAAFDKLNAL